MPARWRHQSRQTRRRRRSPSRFPPFSHGPLDARQVTALAAATAGFIYLFLRPSIRPPSPPIPYPRVMTQSNDTHPKKTHGFVFQRV